MRYLYKSLISRYKGCLSFFVIAIGCYNLLISDVTKMKLTRSDEQLNDENLYDQLEFDRPVKKLVPHYCSSKTLKSMASMEKGIEL